MKVIITIFGLAAVLIVVWGLLWWKAIRSDGQESKRDAGPATSDRHQK
jgi:hypothetical protein